MPLFDHTLPPFSAIKALNRECPTINFIRNAKTDFLDVLDQLFSYCD